MDPPEIMLKKKPKKPTIIIGFPGFGLVGTIATEFLIDHLKTESIGSIWLERLPAMIAVHESKVVQPIGIHYHKKLNLVIIHGVTSVLGLEWKIAQAVLGVAKTLDATQILSIEGIGSGAQTKDITVYHWCNQEAAKKKLEKITKPLKEGIVMGVTGALLIRGKEANQSCFFAETHSQLPDSKAAAKIIEILDQYLGLGVDYQPLLAQAERFEEKLRELLTQSQQASTEQAKKNLSYMG